MINADNLGKLDARDWAAGTRSDDEFAAEEARLVDEMLASADLTWLDTPRVSSRRRDADADSPHFRDVAGTDLPAAGGTGSAGLGLRVQLTDVCEPRVH